jgi:hypothetical protein
MKRIFFSVAILAIPGPLAAQTGGYIIQQPGQAPMYMDRSPSGGYTFQTPGQAPMYMDRNRGGSYTLQNPSNPYAPPTYVDPQGSRPSRYR